jgi:cytidylate kinase
MPIITISRGTMSGGRAVAECLAERLDCPCVGREVLQQAAESLGASEEIVRAKLQTPPGPWDTVTKERHTYVVAVQTALAGRCVTGRLVYHGLAGQLLLRGLPGVLRVRLIAPMALRVQSLIGHHPHTSHEAAERYIQKVDRQRRRWVRAMYGEEVGDTSLYDLTINLRAISLDTACVMITEMVQQPHYEVTDVVRARLEAFAASCREQLDTIVGARR